MGDRYFITVVCPQCGYQEDDVYFAPTCDFVDWTCERCGQFVDLEEYTGISYEDASNATMLEKLVHHLAEFNKLVIENENNN